MKQINFMAFKKAPFKIQFLLIFLMVILMIISMSNSTFAQEDGIQDVPEAINQENLTDNSTEPAVVSDNETNADATTDVNIDINIDDSTITDTESENIAIEDETQAETVEGENPEVDADNQNIDDIDMIIQAPISIEGEQNENQGESLLPPGAEINITAGTTLSETVEDFNTGSGSHRWPFLAIGGKVGLTVSGMFTDSGIVQLPTLSDGSSFEILNFQQGLLLQSAQMVHVYMTFVPMIQAQIEFIFATFKGIDYYARLSMINESNPARADNVNTILETTLYHPAIEALYFEIPILFRFKPDMEKWFGVNHADLYLLTGPTLQFLERVTEKMLQIDMGESYSEDERYVQADTYFSKELAAFDIGWTVAIGYILKDIIPVVNPVFEIRGEFGLLDLNDLSASGTGTDSSTRNWTLYFMVGVDWEIMNGTIF